MNPEDQPGRIAIALGDVTGIGPEVTLKAVAQDKNPRTRYLLIGDARIARALNEKIGCGLSLERSEGEKADARVVLHDPLSQPLPNDLKPGSVEAARAAMAYLRDGAQRCIAGEAAALVTAPVNKESIIRSGETAFTGQTEYLSAMAKADKTAMMLLGEDDRGRWLRVALVTTHLPLKAVAASITRQKVHLAIELAARACADLQLPRSRIAVCGLNPHAGEGGKIGTEELETIKPAVQVAAAQGLDVSGPYAADSLFYYAYRGDYDAVVAMYHDQGLVPLKMIGFERGVNWTLGLPFIRTSPDHGTAYDIAGRGQANPSSMIAAIDLARRLSTR
jgi:4-hydroxythreonine-4-phosphate dehydrogenase